MNMTDPGAGPPPSSAGAMVQEVAQRLPLDGRHTSPPGWKEAGGWGSVSQSRQADQRNVRRRKDSVPARHGTCLAFQGDLFRPFSSQKWVETHITGQI